jgi:hypothetical protein
VVPAEAPVNQTMAQTPRTAESRVKDLVQAGLMGSLPRANEPTPLSGHTPIE